MFRLKLTNGIEKSIVVGLLVGSPKAQPAIRLRIQLFLHHIWKMAFHVAQQHEQQQQQLINIVDN